MYEAEVHVLSDSVLCMGRGAMNEPETKFTKRWNDCLEQYRKSARRIRISHISCTKTIETVREIDDCSTGSRRRWTTCYSRNLSSSSSLHRNDACNSDFFTGTEGRHSAISARRGKKCSLLREVQARILHVHWSRFRKDLLL